MTIFNFIAWKIFFTGLWAQLWAQTWPVIAIALLVAGAIFSTSIPVIGPWLAPLRKWMLVAAGAIGIYFVGQTHGIIIADAKWKARAEAVKKTVDDKVKTSPLDDPNWSDPFNSPDN